MRHKFRPSESYDWVCGRCNGCHEGEPCPETIQHEGRTFKVLSIKEAMRRRMSGRVNLFCGEYGLLPVSSMPIIGRLFVTATDSK